MADQQSGPPTRAPYPSRSQPISSRNRPTQSTAGYVDFYGPSPLGWMIGGWIAAAWDRDINTPDVELCIDDEITSEHTLMLFYHRPDVGKSGHGFIMVLPGATPTGTTLGWVTLASPRGSFTLIPAAGPERLTNDAILEKARTSFGNSLVTGNRDLIRQLLQQPTGAGYASLENLAASVFLVVEETFSAPPNGVALRGWFFDPAGAVQSVRIHGNGTHYTLREEDWIRIPRPDIRKTIHSADGDPGPDCGFLAFAPNVMAPDGSTYIEIETGDGERAFKNVPLPHKQGLAAIESILSGLHLRRTELQAGFDHVLGPTVSAINAQRLLTRPQVRQIQFGAGPTAPRCSIVVPLYGRVDFMEYQLAFAPRAWGTIDEIIYVLDDPRRSQETEALAHSCHERFRTPFTLLCLDRNMGFAPANNIGLTHARGEYVCLLNSDIFPEDPSWMDYMIETLEHYDDIGAVGALLLFEDGSIQHEGGAFVGLPEFANWHFPIHTNKGRRPDTKADVRTVDMITAACLTMKRVLLANLGNLDESYVIGDFEDADLSHRIRAMGLRCVVDRRAVLYHLERQSQNAITNSWRMNLTLFNAWVHERRWFSTANA